MECPKCGSTVTILYTDELLCDACGNDILIDYCVCDECGFSFRSQNNKFLDENMIEDVSLLDKFDELLSEAVDDYEPVSVDESMLDQLRACIRCGSLKAYEESPGVFRCPECDFSWEILKDNE